MTATQASVHPIDGRQARSSRAREAVAEALLQLIHDGELRPTAARIAEKAGVSLRLVFHHFSDLEALFATAAALQLERVLPTIRPVPTGGPLPDRIAAFVAERARLLELVAPVRRAAVLVEPFSETVAGRLSQVRAWKRSEIQTVFARELAQLPPDERSARAAALGVIGSHSCWEELRVHQGLPAREARRVLASMIAAVVSHDTRSPSAPAGSPRLSAQGRGSARGSSMLAPATPPEPQTGGRRRKKENAP